MTAKSLPFVLAVVALGIGVVSSTGTSTPEPANDGFAIVAKNIQLPSPADLVLHVDALERHDVKAFSGSVNLALSVPQEVCDDCRVRLTADGGLIGSFSFDLDSRRVAVRDLYLADEIDVDAEETLFLFQIGGVTVRVDFITVLEKEQVVEFGIDSDGSGDIGPREWTKLGEPHLIDGDFVYVDSWTLTSLPVVAWEARFGTGINGSATGTANFLVSTGLSGDGEFPLENSPATVYVETHRTSDLYTVEITGRDFRPAIAPRFQPSDKATHTGFVALGERSLADAHVELLREASRASGAEPTRGAPEPHVAEGVSAETFLQRHWVLLTIVGAVLLVALLGGIAYWFTRPPIEGDAYS